VKTRYAEMMERARSLLMRDPPTAVDVEAAKALIELARETRIGAPWAEGGSEGKRTPKRPPASRRVDDDKDEDLGF
jgi:hypothetical protein